MVLIDDRGAIGFVICMGLAIPIGLMLFVGYYFIKKKGQGRSFAWPKIPKVLMPFCSALLVVMIGIALYTWQHLHNTKIYTIEFEPSTLQSLDPEHLIPCIQRKINCPEAELRVFESGYFSVTFENSAQQEVNACVYQIGFSFFAVKEVEGGLLELMMYQATKTAENNIQIVYCGRSRCKPTTVEQSEPLSTLLNAVKDFPIQLYQSSTFAGEEDCDYYNIQWAPNKALDAEVFSYDGAGLTNNEDRYWNFFIAHCKKKDSGFGGPMRAELHYIP